jgi:NAD(P)-dependent dehydrogenase (short-subunit alcohol dehydrogenase family)
MTAGERVALVTGGGRGIGLACVTRLLADGFRAGVVEINEQAIASARAALARQEDRVHFATASVSDRATMARAVAEIVARWGRIDVLVNNAAVNRSGGLLTQSDTDWHAVLETNLTGAFVASAVVAAVMREQRSGAVINIGSIGAAGFGASPAYAASKAGLIGLTRQMAHELGPDGITVNLVAPGVTTTGWVLRHLGPERVAATEAATPLRRVGTPEDIAGVVAFLASADARHVTGQVISVSGGSWMP